MKSKTFLPLLFLALAATPSQADPKYPQPTGFVNDFAGLLPANVKQDLENRLRQYAKETEIELAVVTVNSLEDLTVEEYTLGLAQKWGVGNKKKDSGIIFLTAPNERKTRIEVGYGMESDLTDAKAKELIESQIIPLFKEKKMAEGVAAGVAGILATLGPTPYQTRLEERRIAEEKAKREREEAAQAFKSFMTMVALFLSIFVPLVVVVILLIRAARKRNELKALHEENGRIIRQCETKSEEAVGEFPLAVALLEKELKGQHPKETWIDLDKLVKGRSKDFGECVKTLRQLKTRHQKEGWKRSASLREAILALETDLTRAANLLEEVQARSAELRKAEKDSRRLVADIHLLLELTTQRLAHADVSTEAKQLLGKAASELPKTEKLLKSDTVNWLTTFTALTAVAALISKAAERGASDVSEAKRARKEGPNLLEKIPGMILSAEETVKHDDVSEETKSMVSRAKRKFKEMNGSISGANTHWPAIFPTLENISSQLTEAKKKAKKEIEEKERRREDSYSSTTVIISGGGGSSDGGGGFGGFGGGGFGGGGASGSW